MKSPSIVPENETGMSSDNEFSVQKPNEASARQLFELGKKRLLNVNEWNRMSGIGSAVFRLTDESGKEVNRSAQLGDHFKIDIPGPGTVTGNGHDWVQIEAIEEKCTNDFEIVAIRVRPASNPNKEAEDVAHFFSDEASSTFSIVREGKVVSAAVNGRNEKPNLKTDKLLDKLRNVVVGTTAMAGMNSPQWKSLVKGLLSE